MSSCPQEERNWMVHCVFVIAPLIAVVLLILKWVLGIDIISRIP